LKVDRHDEAAPARPASNKGCFQEVLKRTGPEAATTPLRGGQVTRPSGIPSRASIRTVATSGLARTLQKGAFASAEHLGQVRQGLNAEAHRLQDARGEAHQMNQERVRQRVTDLIARELSREPRTEPGTPRSPPTTPDPEASSAPAPQMAPGMTSGEPRTGGPGGARASAADAPNPEARVQATLELIEKLEVFVKSQRPALAMRLGGALDATVEVERTGAREVALRIQGHRGPLPQEDLTRIRDALTARGLKLSAFLTS
jgi:hypothetical protein